MPIIDTRDKLVDALNQACELEHLLCCAYLYAGFSIRRTVDGDGDATLTLAQTETTRAWATQVMLIARQEMEHLGMACNLLSAIGAAPNFARSNFPQGKSYYPVEKPFDLAPFSVEALELFIQFEAPDPGTPATAGAAETDPLIPYDSLQQLYEEIRAGFEFLNENLGPETFFIGPTDAQVTNVTLFQQTESGYQVNLNGILDPDPANRLPEAINLIEQIIYEGEGGPIPITDPSGPNPDLPQQSHFERFKKIRDDYIVIQAEHPQFAPAKPVATNPQTFHHSTGGVGTAITDPFTLKVAHLFNMIYETMLLMLIRMYAHTDETADELKALEEVAFFPLMTMGIRPVGEILTELPVSAENPGTMAGPPFEIYRPLHFLPDKQAAWAILQELLNGIGQEATELAKEAGAANLPIAERLEFISKNLVRNAENFEWYITGKEDF